MITCKSCNKEYIETDYQKTGYQRHYSVNILRKGWCDNCIELSVNKAYGFIKTAPAHCSPLEHSTVIDDAVDLIALYIRTHE